MSEYEPLDFWTLLQQTQAQEPFVSGNPLTPTSLQSVEKPEEQMGLLESLGAGIGSGIVAPKVLSKLGRAGLLGARLAGMSPPATLGLGAAGALYGAYKAFREGKPWYLYPVEMGKGAFEWAMPITSILTDMGKTAFQGAIGRRPIEDVASQLGADAATGIIAAAFGLKDKGSVDRMLFRHLTGKEPLMDALKPTAQYVQDIALPFGKRFEKQTGATTIGEIVGGPIERVPEPVQQNFINQRVVQEAQEPVFEQIGQAAKSLTLEDKVSLLKALSSKNTLKAALKGNPLALKPEVQDLVRKVSGIDPTTESFIGQEYKGAVMAQFHQNLAGAFNKLPKADIYSREIVKRLQGVTDEKVIQKSLKDIMTNPIIGEETRAVARALHDMPYTVESSLRKSWKKTSIDLLQDQIMQEGEGLSWITRQDFAKMPGQIQDQWVSAKSLGKGYDVFGDVFLHRDTYHALQGIVDSEKIGTSFASKFIARPLKMSAVIGRPAALVRNTFGNFILNMINGKHSLDITNVKVYKEALDQVVKNSREFQLLKKYGGKGLGVFAHEEVPPWHRAVSSNQSMLDTVFDYFSYSLKPFSRAYGFVETWAKHAKFLNNLKNGMPEREAALDAIRATFDYADVPKGVRHLRTGWMPFATFQQKILTALPKAAAQHPMRLMGLYYVPWAISQAAMSLVGISEHEFEEMRKNMPEYLQQGMYMMLPWRDSKGRLQMANLTWWIPGIGDVGELASATGRPERFIQNPAVNLMADFRDNQKGATGIPIFNTWDSSGVKALKMVGHMYQSISPPWFPGGTDWKSAYNTLLERENASTFGQLIGSQFGGKITAVTPELLSQGFSRRQAAIKEDIEAEFRRSLRNATTPEDKQNIIEQYQQALQWLYAQTG